MLIRVIELHTLACAQMCAKRQSVWPRLVDQRCNSTLVCPAFKWTRYIRVSLNQPPVRAASLLSTLPCCMVSTKIISWMCMSRFLLAFVHLLFFPVKAKTTWINPTQIKPNPKPCLLWFTHPAGVTLVSCSWFLPLCRKSALSDLGQGETSLFWYVGRLAWKYIQRIILLTFG